MTTVVMPVAIILGSVFRSAFYQEDIAKLHEIWGYCLIPTTKAQATLMIIGSGDEGKSRIGDVMESMPFDAVCRQRVRDVLRYKLNITDKEEMIAASVRTANGSNDMLENLIKSCFSNISNKNTK